MNIFAEMKRLLIDKKTETGMKPRILGAEGFPRKQANAAGEQCKGTRKGASHFVNLSGLGGPARKMHRNMV